MPARLLILFLLLQLSCLHGQEYLFEVQYLGVENGLPNRKVYDITQDKDNMIWLSTPGQIHRYDSEQLISYNNLELGIGESAHIQLEVDVHNRIWFCRESDALQQGSGGILDPATGALISMEEVSGGMLRSTEIDHITRDGEAVLAVSKNGEVYAYDGQWKSVFRPQVKRSGKYHIQPSRHGGLWWMHDDTLLKVAHGEIQDSFHLGPERGRVTRVLREKPDFVVESRLGLVTKANYSWTGSRYDPYDFGTQDQAYKEILEMDPDFSCILDRDTLKVLDRNGEVQYRNTAVHSASTKFRYFSTHFDRDSILWVASTAGIYKLIRKRIPSSIFRAGKASGAFTEMETTFT